MVNFEHGAHMHLSIIESSSRVNIASSSRLPQSAQISHLCKFHATLRLFVALGFPLLWHREDQQPCGHAAVRPCGRAAMRPCGHATEPRRACHRILRLASAGYYDTDGVERLGAKLRSERLLRRRGCLSHGACPSQHTGCWLASSVAAGTPSEAPLPALLDSDATFQQGSWTFPRKCSGRPNGLTVTSGLIPGRRAVRCCGCSPPAVRCCGCSPPLRTD